MVVITKYYAVKKGRNPGIYTSWTECEKQVSGFSGAIYKSFATEEEAQSFLKEEELQKNIIERSKNNNYKQLKAYVDGSYSSDKNIYSYGCVLIDGNEITKLSGTGIDSKWLKLRNVAGEMLAVMKAVKWAYEHEFDDILIYYDYEGLAKWPTGEWKTNRKETAEYVSFLDKYLSKINIRFIKVRAHSGDTYNEKADELAKRAILNSGKGLSDQATATNHESIVVEQIFHEQIFLKNNKKNNVLFKINQYELSEEKLIRIAKEVWKKQGNMIKDIDSINVTVETDSLEIKWEITDKLEDVFNFKMVME